MADPPPTIEGLLEHRRFLRSLSRSLVHDEHEAEDLVQQTWLAAMERPPRRQGGIRSWLARVTRNLAINARAREGRRAERERFAARADVVDDPVEVEAEIEVQRQLVESLQGLREPYRTTLHLRYFRDLGPTDIALRQGVPVKTVKTRLRRGLELLRTELDRRHAGDRGAWLALLSPLAGPPPVPLGPPPGAAAPTASTVSGPLWIGGGITALVLGLVAGGVFVGMRHSDGVERASPALPAVEGAGSAPGPSNAEPEGLGVPTGGRHLLDAAPTSPPASAEPGLLAGRVVDPDGGPIPGARVTSSSRGRRGRSWKPFGALEVRSETTDAEGRFILPLEGEGSVRLGVEAAGFAPLGRRLSMWASGRLDLGELVLEPGVLLGGRVVDDLGRPVTGAEIRQWRDFDGISFEPRTSQLTLVARTDEEGRFVIDHQAVGPWALLVTSPDHPLTTVRGETASVGAVVEGIVVRLEGGLEITGRVLGAPWPESEGAYVHAVPQPGARGADAARWRTRRATIAPDGSFSLHGLERGRSFRLSLRRDGGRFGTTAHSTTVLARSGERDVELAWSAGAALVLRIVEAGTGEPLERFQVEAGFRRLAFLRDGDEIRESHPGGRVRFEDLLPDGWPATASLRISAPGFETLSVERVLVRRGEEVLLGDLAVRRLPTGTLTIVDDATGKPVEGAWVGLRPTRPEGDSAEQRRGSWRERIAEEPDWNAGRTDATGACSLAVLPGREHVILVRAPGYGPAWIPWRPSLAGEPQEVRLRRGGSVEVTVVDSAGDPVDGAQVLHRFAPSAGPPRWGAGFDRMLSDRAGSDGRLLLRNLPAGLHRLRVASFAGPGERSRGASDGWTEVEVGEGQTLEVTLVTPPHGGLRGVIREAGAPVPGARIRIRSLNARSRGLRPRLVVSAVTGSRGGYVLRGLAIGEHRIEILHPSRAMSSTFPVSIAPGEMLRDFDLDTTTLEGRVTDEEGNALVGIPVRAVPEEDLVPQRAWWNPSVSADPSMLLRVFTGEDGRYVLRGVQADVTLRVEAGGASRALRRSAAIRLLGDEARAGVDFVLEQAARIVVHVDGERGVRRRVLIRAAPDPPSPTLPIHTSIASTREPTILSGLAPGAWVVEVLTADVPRRRVEVEPGGTTTIRFDLH